MNLILRNLHISCDSNIYDLRLCPDIREIAGKFRSQDTVALFLHLIL